MTVHAGLAVLAFALVVPAAVEFHRTMSHVSLVVPVMDIKPAPELQHFVVPKITTRAKIFVPPLVVVPPVKLPQIAEAPEIKPVQPPESNVELIQTGAFQPATELAKALPTQKVQVGGFGDPYGARPSDNSRQAPVPLTKVGAFDLPDNTGRNGGGGRVQSGNTIRLTGFGNAGDPGRPRTANNDAIRSTAFGDATITPPPSAKKAENVGAGFTPVEILFKPKPAYSVEAREMRLEGEVSLQVVFQASGTIRVVRVVQGLGHGLDEAAEQAAMRVRFKPAKRGGVPVDSNATIKISFELT
jgi:TonB family protein